MADRPGPNGRLPHGTATARTTHLAHGEVLCDDCQPVDDCEGCPGALAALLRELADVIAAMVPAGRLEATCPGCGRTRTYGLSEVD